MTVVCIEYERESASNFVADHRHLCTRIHFMMGNEDLNVNLKRILSPKNYYPKGDCRYILIYKTNCSYNTSDYTLRATGERIAMDLSPLFFAR